MYQVVVLKYLKITLIHFMCIVKADYHSEACPDGMSVCECPQSQNRCIYTDLFCNGVANCGAVCGHDENTCSNAGGSSGGQQGSGSETTIQSKFKIWRIILI